MKEITYWKWKNTIIDFKTLSNEKNNYGDYITKKDMVFQYLGTPDEEIHEWYNGGWSSEYNEALKYAKELGLVEDYIDYEEIRFENNEIKKDLINLQNRIDKAVEYIEKNTIDTTFYIDFDGEINYVLNLLKGDNK